VKVTSTDADPPSMQLQPTAIFRQLQHLKEQRIQLRQDAIYNRNIRKFAYNLDHSTRCNIFSASRLLKLELSLSRHLPVSDLTAGHSFSSQERVQRRKVPLLNSYGTATVQLLRVLFGPSLRGSTRESLSIPVVLPKAVYLRADGLSSPS
jgi:hypothetical protein